MRQDNGTLLTMNFAPGQRISNRDEDFLVTEVIENKGGWILHADGISELVKARRFVFDTKIDKDIRVLDVINAMVLRLSFEELKPMYNIPFPVLHQNEGAIQKKTSCLPVTKVS